MRESIRQQIHGEVEIPEHITGGYDSAFRQYGSFVTHYYEDIEGALRSAQISLQEALGREIDKHSSQGSVIKIDPEASRTAAMKKQRKRLKQSML